MHRRNRPGVDRTSTEYKDAMVALGPCTAEALAVRLNISTRRVELSLTILKRMRMVEQTDSRYKWVDYYGKT